MTRQFLNLGLVLLVGLLLIAPCHAQKDDKNRKPCKQLSTAQTVTFGDSLTDNELLYTFFGTDPAIYNEDPMEAFFNKASSPGDQLANFAILGSTSADVLAQVEYYADLRKSNAIGRASLISLQAGGNDILDIVNGSANLFLLASAAPGESRDADRVIRGIKKNLLTSIQKLKRVDRAPVVLWTVPDVTFSPYVLSFGFTPEETNNIRLHIQKINRFLRARGSSSNFVVLDIYTVGTMATLMPPVILGTEIQPTPALGFATAQFADPIHPTGVINAILANELIERVNEQFGSEIPVYSELELAAIAGIIPN